MKKCPICKRGLKSHKKPSRCLDAWVAEYVMGWLPPTNIKTKEARWEHCYHQDAYNEHFLDQHGRLRMPEPFSTSWFHAISVIDKLNVLYFQVGREFCAGIRYDITIYDDCNMKDKVYIKTEEAAFGICKAALEWKLKHGDKKCQSHAKKSLKNSRI